MEALQAAFFLAIVGERFTEYFITPLFNKFGWDKAYLLYIGALPGFILALAAGIDLFAILPIVLPAPVGMVTTGLLVGGGANLVHDIFNPKTQ